VVRAPAESHRCVHTSAESTSTRPSSRVPKFGPDVPARRLSSTQAAARRARRHGPGDVHVRDDERDEEEGHAVEVARDLGRVLDPVVVGRRDVAVRRVLLHVPRDEEHPARGGGGGVGAPAAFRGRRRADARSRDERVREPLEGRVEPLRRAARPRGFHDGVREGLEDALERRLPGDVGLPRVEAQRAEISAVRQVEVDDVVAL